MPYCAKCGTEIQSDAGFCAKCGAAVSGLDQPTQSAPAPLGQASPPQTQAQHVRQKGAARPKSHAWAWIAGGGCLFVAAVCVLLFVVFAAGALSDPMDTVIPQDIEELDSIRPAYEALDQEDRDLLDRYLMRHLDREVTRAAAAELLGGLGMLGGLLQGEPVSGAVASVEAADELVGPGIPEGITIGQAIAEQKRYEQGIDR